MRNENQKFIIIIIVSLFLVIGVVASVYYFSDKNIPQPEQENAKLVSKAPTANPKPDNLSETTAKLYVANSITVPPKIVDAKTIEKSVLPIDLINLIPADAYYTKVESIKFADNKLGFKILYQMPSLIYLNQTFYAAFSTKGWKIVKAAHTSIVGLMFMQKDKFDTWVEESVVDEKNINVILTIVSK